MNDSGAPRRGEPDASEAAAALALARGSERRGHRLWLAQSTRSPLLCWGIVWIADGLVFRFLPLPLAAVISLALLAGTVLLLRVVRSAEVRSGWEEVASRSWWTVLLGSAALVAVLVPIAAYLAVLLLAALWGLMLLLYAVIASDRALGLLGGSILLLPPVLRLAGPVWAVPLLGIVGGAAMMLFGLYRMRRPW